MNELDLEAAVRPFIRALDSLDSYGAPLDSSVLMVDADDCLYELLDGEEGAPLTISNLRALKGAFSE